MNTTTKLDVVNALLSSIGEDPINALGVGLEDATVAENIVDEVTRKVFVLGWSWNTNENMPILRQTDNTITVPSNFLSIDFHNPAYVLRGNRIYDRQNNTYVFESDISVNSVVIGLPWDEIPEVARQYILYCSGRIFQARQVGSPVLFQFTLKDEQEAWVALTGNEQETSNDSIFQNNELAVHMNRDAAQAFVDWPTGAVFGSS